MFRTILHGLIILTLVLALLPSFTARAKSQGQMIIRDAEIEHTLKLWSAPIIRAAGLSPDAVRLILVQSPDVNAFVAGGQNVFLYTGLIMKTDNADEVVGVIAHELGHIAGGHLVRGSSQMEQASYEVMLGAILGIGVAAATGSGDVGAAIMSGSSALAQRKFLSFSRTQESAADQAGLRFLTGSQINPTGLVTFMKKLADQELLPTSQQNEYIRTHPLSRDRVSTLEQSIHGHALKDQGLPKSWNEQHRRMKAKLMGYITPQQVMWAYDEKDTSFAAGYARALAAYRQNHVDEALRLVNDLIAREPKNAYLYELKGQMLYEFGRSADAVPAYAQAVVLAPSEPLIKLAYAQALAEPPQASRAQLNTASALLEQVRMDEPRISRTYRLLATIQGRLKNDGLAQAWLAEEAFLQARYDEARRLAQAAKLLVPKDSRSARRLDDLLVQLDRIKEKPK